MTRKGGQPGVAYGAAGVHGEQCRVDVELERRGGNVQADVAGGVAAANVGGSGLVCGGGALHQMRAGKQAAKPLQRKVRAVSPN